MPQYKMGDFLENGDIIVDPNVQSRVPMFLAQGFLDNFQSESFEHNGPVGFIFIDDGDLDQLWLSGTLCAQTIEEMERSGKNVHVPVARISFKAVGDDPNWTFKIHVEPVHRAAPALSAADHYKKALDSGNVDVTIRELDACLCANPKPFLAMAAYFNLSAAVWEKFKFNERKGHSIRDDEYLWVKGCHLCLRRALKIYEGMPRQQQLEADVIKLHQAIKGSIGTTISYGGSVYMAGQWRDREVPGLPPLRCLTEIRTPISL